MAVANTSTYYDTATISTIKSFIAQTSGIETVDIYGTITLIKLLIGFLFRWERRRMSHREKHSLLI
jgi:hypothetical protein